MSEQEGLEVHRNIALSKRYAKNSNAAAGADERVGCLLKRVCYERKSVEGTTVSLGSSS